MKRILSSLIAFCLFTALLLSCNGSGLDTPGKDQKEEEVQETDDSQWEWQNGYPKGVKVEEFVWNFSGKTCKGYKATIDFKENPYLSFNCIKTTGARKTPSKFFSDFSKSKGTPVLAVNGGYFAGTTSVSMVITRGNVFSRAWASFNWPSDEKPECVIYPVRAALGQMKDGGFEIQWAYCTDVSFSSHTAYPDVAAIGNNEKTKTFRSAPPTSDETEFPGCKDWKPYEAMGGGPMLVREGRNVAQESYWYECLDAGGTSGLSYVNRTAAGITADGKLILVVCDGRGKNGSDGCTLVQLADKFLEWGCTDALNFDGGGSSAMVGSDGKVLNHPSDAAGERQVVSSIIISEKR